MQALPLMNMVAAPLLGRVVEKMENGPGAVRVLGCCHRGVLTELWCGRRTVRVTSAVFFFFHLVRVLSASSSFSLTE